MPGHIIVCGEDALANRIITELGDADIRALQSPTGLADAEIHSARAIICASAEDALNLEMALLARRANADVRVVARIGNPVLRQAMNGDDGPTAPPRESRVCGFGRRIPSRSQPDVLPSAGAGADAADRLNDDPAL